LALGGQSKVRNAMFSVMVMRGTVAFLSAPQPETLSR
jgi:hypothetical protein